MQKNEQELQLAVQELADYYGILWHHCIDSRLCAGHRGLPDLWLVGSQIVAAELKSYGGYLSTHQTTWRYRLLMAGVPFHTWFPQDLESGEIERVLKLIA